MVLRISLLLEIIIFNMHVNFIEPLAVHSNVAQPPPFQKSGDGPVECIHIEFMSTWSGRNLNVYAYIFK